LSYLNIEGPPVPFWSLSRLLTCFVTLVNNVPCAVLAIRFSARYPGIRISTVQSSLGESTLHFTHPADVRRVVKEHCYPLQRQGSIRHYPHGAITDQVFPYGPRIHTGYGQQHIAIGPGITSVLIRRRIRRMMPASLRQGRMSWFFEVVEEHLSDRGWKTARRRGREYHFSPLKYSCEHRDLLSRVTGGPALQRRKAWKPPNKREGTLVLAGV